MTRRTAFAGSAAGRRRERRAHLQSEVSNSSEVLHRPTPSRVTLSLKRADYTPSSLNVVAAKAATQVKEYRNQIIRATYLFNHEFKRKPVLEGAMCLPEVAIFAAGYRKSESVTAR